MKIMDFQKAKFKTRFLPYDASAHSATSSATPSASLRARFIRSGQAFALGMTVKTRNFFLENLT